jgi:hypothetical protein
MMSFHILLAHHVFSFLGHAIQPFARNNVESDDCRAEALAKAGIPPVD